MAKVNLKLGKAIVRIPGEEVNIQIEGIEVSAEYNAEELNVIKDLFETAMGVTKQNGIEVEFVKEQNKINAMFKDFMGTVMNLIERQTQVLDGHNDLHKQHTSTSEKFTDILGRMFGLKKEEAISSEELETRKQKVEFYKSGV